MREAEGRKDEGKGRVGENGQSNGNGTTKQHLNGEDFKQHQPIFPIESKQVMAPSVSNYINKSAHLQYNMLIMHICC